MQRSARLLIFGIVTLSLACKLNAAVPFVLTFDALQDEEPIGSFYDGGLGGKGSGPGPDYDLSFSSHALGFKSIDPQFGTLLYWTHPTFSNIVINVPNGFEDGYFMYYLSDLPGSISIYDDLNATGNQLAANSLADTNFTVVSMGLNFGGVARSVLLSGVSDQIAFDNLTFGSSQPFVPEPGSIQLMSLGAMAALTRMRRHIKARPSMAATA
jgi:hypothetical protein